MGIRASPSLYVVDVKLGAGLDVSPKIYYQDFVLIMPFHSDLADKWI